MQPEQREIVNVDRRNRSSRPGPRGFTLVELLVVVSILALLIAILLPSLRSARDQAKSTVCATHLRNQGQAMQMYAGEYDGSIPRDIGGTASELPFAVPLLWMLGTRIDTNRDYAAQFRDIELIQCPSFPRDNTDAAGKRLAEQALDYVVNGFPKKYTPDPIEDALLAVIDPKAIWQPAGKVFLPPEKLSDIRNVSGIIYVTEAHRRLPSAQPSNWRASWGPWPYPYHDVWKGAHLPRGKNPRVANDRRHTGRINSVFFDGHVQARRPESLVDTDFYFPY